MTRTIVKCLAAVVLLVSFVLPISRCPDPLLPPGDDSSPYIFKRPCDYCAGSPSVGSAMVLLAFFWPLALLPLTAFGWRARRARLMAFVEVLLCLETGYIIWALTRVGEPWWGALTACLGLLAYAGAVLMDIARLRRGQGG